MPRPPPAILNLFPIRVVFHATLHRRPIRASVPREGRALKPFKAKIEHDVDQPGSFKPADVLKLLEPFVLIAAEVHCGFPRRTNFHVLKYASARPECQAKIIP